jgi:hypothetical protein
MLKYLRIAVTAICLTACVLLVVLWVRSYSWWDTVEKRTSSWLLRGSSARGRLCFSHIDPSRDPAYKTARVVSDTLDGLGNSQPFLSLEIDDSHPMSFGGFFGLEYRDNTDISKSVYDISRSVIMPYWLPVFLSGVFAAIPWIHWSKRFSLRTLLIATMLVAVGLGFIIWAARRI